MRNKECLKDTMNENKEEVLIKLISYIIRLQFYFYP